VLKTIIDKEKIITDGESFAADLGEFVGDNP
jgi:hypothetical protein